MYSVCNDLKGRVSPFGNLRIKARLLAPRSLSQATTSFIACNRQGIHHVHLFTCPYNVGLCMSYRDRHRIQEYNYVCLIQITTTLSVHRISFSIYATRLKKLYFFQIVKERELHLSKPQGLHKYSEQ